MWQPFAPDAVRILRKALAIAAKAGAPRLDFDHLYCAVAEELGPARVRLLRVPESVAVLRGLAATGGPAEIRSSRLSRDVRRVVDRAIRIAATRLEPRRHITGDDLVRAMYSRARRRVGR
jgi:hypothetical protein